MRAKSYEETSLLAACFQVVPLAGYIKIVFNIKYFMQCNLDFPPTNRSYKLVLHWKVKVSGFRMEGLSQDAVLSVCILFPLFVSGTKYSAPGKEGIPIVQFNYVLFK